MLKVYIIYSTNDKFFETVVTLLAETDDQALQMASKETDLPVSDLQIYETCHFLDHAQIIDKTTNYFGV